MQTKFSQLLKVKQQKVDEIEVEMLDIQNQKKSLLLKIEHLDKDISEISKPVSGHFSQLNLSYTVLSNLSEQKERYNEEVTHIDKQIMGLQELYKEANIEFEKVKYLDDQEIQKILHLMKVEEKKEMDEIANLLYKRRREEIEL
ncbi:MAG: flagellar export protein FliJ [Epsilonproteobacteria bacterium]|nr:flagellar export protein FliJ [Campylobacterota bacterium]